MTRPIAALRSPTLMNILANVALWLQVDYPAMPEAPPLIPPTGDIQAPRPLSRRFRLLYPLRADLPGSERDGPLTETPSIFRCDRMGQKRAPARAASAAIPAVPAVVLPAAPCLDDLDDAPHGRHDGECNYADFQIGKGLSGGKAHGGGEPLIMGNRRRCS